MQFNVAFPCQVRLNLPKLTLNNRKTYIRESLPGWMSIVPGGAPFPQNNPLSFIPFFFSSQEKKKKTPQVSYPYLIKMHPLPSIALILAYLTFAIADCCEPSCACDPFDGCLQCGDNSDPTPCCGNGACNVFCCNCDGGKFIEIEGMKTLSSNFY